MITTNCSVYRPSEHLPLEIINSDEDLFDERLEIWKGLPSAKEPPKQGDMLAILRDTFGQNPAPFWVRVEGPSLLCGRQYHARIIARAFKLKKEVKEEVEEEESRGCFMIIAVGLFLFLGVAIGMTLPSILSP